MARSWIGKGSSFGRCIMKRMMVIAMGLGLVGLTGCSELQVIRSAALRELSAEAVSLDTLAQQRAPVTKDEILSVPELRPARRTMGAKAAYNPFLVGAVKGSAGPRKGQWEEGK